MNFSKNSWHFRFARKYGGLTIWDDEAIRTSLCEYVKRVMLGLFLFSVACTLATYFTFFGIGGFIALATYGAYQWQFFGPFFIASAIILTLSSIIGIMVIVGWWLGRDSRRMDKEWKAYSNANPDAEYWKWRHSYYDNKKPSLIKEWIKAKKEKVCPIITIE